MSGKTSRELRFVVPGKPQGKQRPRRGKGGRFYTPPETKHYEHLVRSTSLRHVLASRRPGTDRWTAIPESQRWPVDHRGPVEVELQVYWPDRRRRDADNVLKSVMDGLQTPRKGWGSGLITDDSQVVRASVAVSVDRERPRAEVVVRMVNEGLEGE